MQKPPPENPSSSRTTTSDGTDPNSAATSPDDALRARLIADIVKVAGTPALGEALNAIISDRYSTSATKYFRRDE